MTTPPSNQSHWQHILRRQRLTNAERWLQKVEGSEEPAALVGSEYDNLLRALETALEGEDTFDLAYRLIQALFPVVFGYSDTARWLVYLDHALTQTADLERPLERARLLEQMADLKHDQGELEAAESFYQQAVDSYQALDHKVGSARALAKLAGLYALQGQPAAGEALGRQALKVAESSGDASAVANANLSLSHIYANLGRWSEGLTTATVAYTFYWAERNEEPAITALMNILACQTKLEQWLEANKTATVLTELLESSGNLRMQIQHKINVGSIAFMQAQYFAAETAWQEGLSLASQVQTPAMIASLTNNLGMVYTRIGDYTSAEAMLEQAIQAYQTMGNLRNWVNSLDNLADLYEAQGNQVACRKTLQRALDALEIGDENAGCEDLLAKLRGRLGNLPAA